MPLFRIDIFVCDAVKRSIQRVLGEGVAASSLAPPLHAKKKLMPLKPARDISVDYS